MVDPPAVVAPTPTTHGTGAAATPGGAKAAKKAVRPPGGGAGGSPGDAALVTPAARAAAPHVAVTGSTGRRDENANPQSLFGTDLVLPQFGAFSANGDAAFPHDRQADKRARRRNDTRVLFAAGAGGGAKNRSRPRGFPTCGCSGGCSKDTCLGRGISMQQHSVRYVAQHTYAAQFHEGDVVSCCLRSGDSVQRGEILKRRPATGSNEPMYKVAIPPTAEVERREPDNRKEYASLAPRAHRTCEAHASEPAGGPCADHRPEHRGGERGDIPGQRSAPPLRAAASRAEAQRR